VNGIDGKSLEENEKRLSFNIGETMERRDRRGEGRPPFKEGKLIALSQRKWKDK